jgi:hypothetical protein
MIEGVSDQHIIVFLTFFVIATVIAYLAVENALLIYKRRAEAKYIERFHQERLTLEQKAEEMEKVREEISKLIEKTETLRKNKKSAAKEADKEKRATRCFVHDIGVDESGKTQFTFELKSKIPAATIQNSAAIFHKSIWAYRNVARVWASDLQLAATILRSVFPEKSNIAYSESDGGPSAGPAFRGSFANRGFVGEDTPASDRPLVTS